MLTAEEMGFSYTPESKSAYKVSFVLKGGYPVGTITDTSPALQGVRSEGDRTYVYMTKDHGLTWKEVGYYCDGRLSEPGSHDYYVALEEDG